MVSRSTVPPARDEADVSGATPRTVRAINDRVDPRAAAAAPRRSPARSWPRLTGLSKPTATQLLQRLAESGLIVPRGTTTGAPGPNAQLYGLNERAAFVAAVDVDEHRLTAAVADLAGQRARRGVRATPTSPAPRTRCRRSARCSATPAAGAA